MREKIRLMSSAGTGHSETTTKDRRLHPEKMENKKYDTRIRTHVIYKETKMKKHRAGARHEKPASRRVFRFRFPFSGQAGSGERSDFTYAANSSRHWMPLASARAHHSLKSASRRSLLVCAPSHSAFSSAWNCSTF